MEIKTEKLFQIRDKTILNMVKDMLKGAELISFNTDIVENNPHFFTIKIELYRE
jgi:hypothetical protein